jgi:hypothetical protein
MRIFVPYELCNLLSVTTCRLTRDILSWPSSDVTYMKTVFWIGRWIYWTLTAYNTWLRFTVTLRPVLTIAIYTALSLFYTVCVYHSLQSTPHAGSSGPRVPPTNGGRSLFWVPVPQTQKHLIQSAITIFLFWLLLLSLGTAQQLLHLDLCPVTNLWSSGQ